MLSRYIGRLAGQRLKQSRHLSTDSFECDVTVIGGGVVGLAIAQRLAQSENCSVILLEKESQVGSGTSSRNSEVIHAGIYYPTGSLKAQLCVQGRQLLYAFCRKHSIPHKVLGKLVVTSSPVQHGELESIAQVASENGVDDIKLLSSKESKHLEPALQCTAALHSPSTGIIDSHAYLMELQRQVEENGGIVSLYSKVERGDISGTIKHLEVNCKGERMQLRTSAVINATGLHAHVVAETLGINKSDLPPCYYAKGSYYTLSGSRTAPFHRLIYPVPQNGGLGVHLTLDTSGKSRFGPDVEWLPSLCIGEDINYSVNPETAPAFYTEIRKYWPELPENALVPDYSGIRPKVKGPGEAPGDFEVLAPDRVGCFSLHGIESPGLTASLALADYVCSKIV